MDYANVGIIALLVHVIINFDVLKISREPRTRAHATYRNFLICVLFYYIFDFL